MGVLSVPLYELTETVFIMPEQRLWFKPYDG